MINDCDIEKAARYFLDLHGDNAVARAEDHAAELRREGLGDTADAWQRVAQRLGAGIPSD